MATSQKINAPAPGTKQSIYAQPNEKLELNFDLKDVRVDILGSDLVLTFKDGGQLIMDNMAVLLFSDDAPQLIASGQLIPPDDILSNIGIVQSVSGRDAAILTSMQADAAKNEPVVVEKVVVKESPPIIVNPPPTLQSTALSSEGAEFSQKSQKALQDIISERSQSIADNNNVGKFTVPPVNLNPPKIEAQAPPPFVENAISATYSFEAKLLQIGPSTSTDMSNVLTYQGGGGNGASTLIADALTQIQRDFIDVTRHSGAATIYADTSTYFTPTLLSRALDIVPDIPDSYALETLVISGIPAGISLLGFTPDIDGTYTIPASAFTSGTQNFILQYDPTTFTTATDLDGDTIANEYLAFTIEIDSSVYGGLNGTTRLTDNKTYEVVIKDTTLTDYSYGADGWVLDLKPNENIIVAGDGGITVYGGSELDRISTGTGADTIYASGGNDTITTSSGNDIIDVGTGDNIVDGGDGTDLLSYATRSENINFDLGGTQNVFGEITVSVGGSQSDLVKGIENVTTGSGTDSLTGSSLDNVLTGGAGDDFLMGRGGNDTLDGGDDTDTVSYAYAGNAVTIDLQAGTGVVGTGDSDTITNVENIIGSDYNDSLAGDANINVIEGGDGDDLLNGRTGDDVIDGGAGNNTLSFTDQTSGVTLTLNDTGSSTATSVGGDTITLSNIHNITGSGFDDVLTGNDDDNIIRSGDGNDTLDGDGGTGDILSYDDQTTGITADLGAGTVTKGAGTDNFSNFEILTATGQDDTVIGGALINTMNGGAGTDTLSYENTSGDVTVSLAAGTTSGALTQTFTSFENVTGGTGNDTLTGDAAANTIVGGDGDDTLNANGGNDTLDGGNNNDTATFETYVTAVTVDLGTANIEVSTPDADLEDSPDDIDLLDNELDVVTLLNIETVVGTTLEDTFQSGSTARTVSLNGGSGIDVMTFASETNTVTADLSGTATGDFGTYTFLSNSIENLIGGSGDDVLTGTTGDNEITGGDGADTLNANGGNDILDGGDGTDTATYASYGAAVTVALADLEVTDNNGDVSTLVNIESIVGTDYDDTFTSGLSISNFTLNAGDGTDTLDFTPLQAAVTVNLTSGTATVGLSNTYSVSNFENIVGGGLGDTLTGSTGDNIISGGNGNDIFYVSGGDDTFYGGDGTDYYSYLSSFGSAISAYVGAATITVTNGSYTNTLYDIEWIGGTSSADTFYSGSTARTLTLDGNGGSDTINFSSETNSVVANLGSNATGDFGTYTFYASRIENIVGGSGNDTLTGTANNSQSNGNNTINGGDGDDFITGNGGHDTIIGGIGTDTASFSAVGQNISVNLGTGAITYTDSNNKASNNTISTIEVVITGSGNDTYTVGGTGQTFSLDAGSGTDHITFASESSAVTADLNSGATGAFGTYTFLNTSFENLTGGSAGDILTGTSSANRITGNAGDDTITAGGGNDVVFGGDGTDTIYGNDNDDIIDDSNSTYASNNSNIIDAGDGNDSIFLTVADNTIEGGAGTDSLRYDTLVYSGSSFYGSSTSDALTFTLSADSLSGTVTNSVYTDNFSNIEVFYGSAGNDIFRGGSGDDTFHGSTGSDTLDYSTALAGVTVNLSAGLTSDDGRGGQDTFTGMENVTGSAFDDMITGTNTENILDGGAGNDTFIGGAGNDYINGRGDTDTLDYSAQSAAITFDLNESSATSTAIGSDTYVNIENIDSGSGDDFITGSPSSFFANTVTFDLGDGEDSVVLSSGTVGTDATTFASKLENVEYLNFLNTNTASGNMVIDGDDVFMMTDIDHALRLDINGAFGLTVNGGSYTLDTGATVGGVTTYTFLTGATPMATLEVHVV